MSKTRVLVACWTGAATSTIVLNKLRQYLESKNLDVDIVKCTVAEVEYYTKTYQPVMILSTTKLPQGASGNVPVVDAVPLLTGVGDAEVLEKVVQAIGRVQS